MSVRYRISVEGMVQGVGFRPFVYRLARELGLGGWVKNTTDGVVAEVEGEEEALDEFLRRLETQPPPLARITAVRKERRRPGGLCRFTIRHSLAGDDPNVLVSPDMATCPDCVRELFDPADRRFRYPFINCTNCGPRYTIIRRVPYDRANTSMDAFTMCDPCRAEYEDPGDRRFHAQPNACPDCGPSLALLGGDGAPLAGFPLEKSLELLREGRILAVKGLGGFHLAVDPLFFDAVTRLREKKGREEKPFALMVRDPGIAAKLCRLDEHARRILTSTESPVGLFRRLLSPEMAISPSVAPRSRYFGLMMPYTPVHHLLMERFELLVMTSANLSEEPLCAGNEEALERLAGIADAFLVHDREIVLRCDDSIVRLDAVEPDRGPVVLRRARGFVPSPVALPVGGDPVLALGPELKGTVCLTRGARAFIGQHLGDLRNLETLGFLKETVAHLMDVLQVEPAAVAHDLHPDYLTTGLASGREDVPWKRGTPLLAVQHHHAHVLSAQAEAGITGPCIGVALDGTGFGPDGTVWGGEILLVDGTGMERLGHLRNLWMPGGEKAVEQPWRMALSCLVECFGEAQAVEMGLELFPEQAGGDVQAVARLCAARIHGVWTSSAGRLFDAFSALLGIRARSAYEGQAAIELEVLTEEEAGYILPYTLKESAAGCQVVDLLPAFEASVGMLRKGAARGAVAAMFHWTLAEALAEGVSRAREGRTGLPREVPLGGGVFQNEILCSRLAGDLADRSLRPVFHRIVPTNDGGISYGQAVYALYRQKEEGGG